MRVHELAKKLELTSKDVIAQVEKMGGKVKNHMSLVEEPILSKLLSAGQGKETKETKPSAAPVPPKSSASVKKAEPKPIAVKPVVPVAEKVPPVKATPSVEKEISEKPAAPSKPVEAPAAPAKKEVILRIPITVGELAKVFRVSISDMIKSLMGIGVFANVNQLLNEEIIGVLAEKYGLGYKKEEDEAEQIIAGKDGEDKPEQLVLRPPVVTMMGHVDHGKTSLLDAIRKTNVAAREKGFITQHIGAYGVDIPGKGHVTFLDTPGHEAFTAMRARGANITDVVVLVVAADDGIMPQTIEAIDHAREAGCPIVVAINKVDLPAANPDKVMGELQKYDLMPEEWGGKTICCKVSAKTGKGIDQLLELLLLEAEVLELKANPARAATGIVIEGHLSKGSGPVASIIVQKGTLRIGDYVIAGSFSGKVRALRNDKGKSMKEAGPSYAVEVMGLNGVPEAGETVVVVQDEKTAKTIVEKRTLEDRERQMRGADKHLSLQSLYDRISEGNFKELKLIIKADVQGSVEALAQSLERLGSDEKCRIRVIHGGVGGINESDIMLAAASDAIVIGFHVKAEPRAQSISEREGVELRYYNIIYEAVEDVRKAMEGMLEPTYEEVIEGKIEIRKVFKSSKIGNIGGGFVIKGKIARNHKVRVIRNHLVIFDGKLSSLKRFKDDVREVAQGYECGVAVEKFDDLRERDLIEAYRIEKIATKL